MATNGTFETVKALVTEGRLVWSSHATDEAAHDLIEPRRVEQTVLGGEVIEDYPDHLRGPCVLVLQWVDGLPVHIVWGLRRGTTGPAVVVTVYRPQPPKWADPYTRGRVA